MSDRRDGLNEWLVTAFVIALVNLGIVIPLACAADSLRLSVAAGLSADPDPKTDAEPPPAARGPNIALIRP